MLQQSSCASTMVSEALFWFTKVASATRVGVGGITRVGLGATIGHNGSRRRRGGKLRPTNHNGVGRHGEEWCNV
jgi:hypothetical protein